MTLETIMAQSDVDKKANSEWLSSRLDVGESIVVEKYIKEEVVSGGQYGDQLRITVVCDGQEMMLGRPYPLSAESLRFFKELINVRENPPFVIRKEEDKSKRPIYYAEPYTPKE